MSLKTAYFSFWSKNFTKFAFISSLNALFICVYALFFLILVLSVDGQVMRALWKFLHDFSKIMKPGKLSFIIVFFSLMSRTKPLNLFDKIKFLPQNELCYYVSYCEQPIKQNLSSQLRVIMCIQLDVCDKRFANPVDISSKSYVSAHMYCRFYKTFYIKASYKRRISVC